MLLASLHTPLCTAYTKYLAVIGSALAGSVVSSHLSPVPLAPGSTATSCQVAPSRERRTTKRSGAVVVWFQVRTGGVVAGASGAGAAVRGRRLCLATRLEEQPAEQGQQQEEAYQARGGHRMRQEAVHSLPSVV